MFLIPREMFIYSTSCTGYRIFNLCNRVFKMFVKECVCHVWCICDDAVLPLDTIISWHHYSAKIWNTMTGSMIGSVSHTERITCIARSSDDLYLVTASVDGSLKVWELFTGKLTQVWKCTETFLSKSGSFILPMLRFFRFRITSCTLFHILWSSTWYVDTSREGSVPHIKNTPLRSTCSVWHCAQLKKNVSRVSVLY